MKNRDYAGAADTAVNLVGCKSSHHQLPGIGWLADPMHAEATKHVLLGWQSLGCPAAISRSGRNDRGGEQTWGPEHKKWLQSRKAIRHEIVSTGTCGKPTLIAYGGRPMTWRKKQAGALRGTAVTGAQAPREGFTETTSGRSRRQQGLVATLQRLLERGSGRRRGEPDGIGE